MGRTPEELFRSGLWMARKKSRSQKRICLSEALLALWGVRGLVSISARDLGRRRSPTRGRASWRVRASGPVKVVHEVHFAAGKIDGVAVARTEPFTLHFTIDH